ncbi:pre-mRNA-processing protein 40A [Dorcoceras hygrometricum]|nr:pre-mRNA-processing protein 40A [Dorcoceras hygrometricum]
MAVDQLALHSVQLGYLKILQMGNTDTNNPKAGKQIRGQASDQIARPSYQLANHVSRASIPRTINQPGKSSVRAIPARQPSQLGGIPKRQLGFLIDYINRGGNAKKGESGSSQPHPPPDDQSRPSGGSGDSGSQRRSGSSKSMRSSGESPVRSIRYGPYPPGAPPKRSAKFWMTGEKDF